VYVDTARVRELAAHISATGTDVGDLRTADNYPAVRNGLPGSTVAPAALALALLVHTAMQQVSAQLLDSENRLMATADIYEVTEDDFAADLSIHGEPLW